MTAMSDRARERGGTFDQLLVTPFRPAELMMGKALPSLLVFLSQSTVFLLVAQLWFRIPFAGSFVTLYVGLTLFLLADDGLGLLLSSFVSDDAASAPRMFYAGDAIDALVRSLYVSSQHAQSYARLRFD